MNAVCLILAGLIQLIVVNGTGDRDEGKQVVCYYGDIPYIVGEVLEPEILNVTLCTHLMYFNAKINYETGEIEPRDAKEAYYENGGKGYYDRITKLKEINPKLKVLLRVDICCGSKMPNTTSWRSTYVSSTVAFLVKHGFDGFHLDPIPPQEEEEHLPETYFGLLLMELRAEFDKYGFQLSTILPLEYRLWEVERNLDVISRTCNFVTVLSLNNPKHTGVTELHSPLNLTKSSVDFYRSKNVPANKMLVSVFTLSIPAQLVNLSDSTLGAKAQDLAPDPNQEIRDMISYSQIVKRFGNHTEEWVIHRDEESKSPYATNKYGFWVSYEDSTSVALKCRYAVENNLAGAAIILLDTDDYQGYGGEGYFPLTRTAYEVLTKSKETERR